MSMENYPRLIAPKTEDPIREFASNLGTAVFYLDRLYTSFFEEYAESEEVLEHYYTKDVAKLFGLYDLDVNVNRIGKKEIYNFELSLDLKTPRRWVNLGKLKGGRDTHGRVVVSHHSMIGLLRKGLHGIKISEEDKLEKILVQGMTRYKPVRNIMGIGDEEMIDFMHQEIIPYCRFSPLGRALCVLPILETRKSLARMRKRLLEDIKPRITYEEIDEIKRRNGK